MRRYFPVLLLFCLILPLAGFKDGKLIHGRKAKAGIISPYAESVEIGQDRHRLTISSAPIAYQEGGVWKKIDSAFTDGVDCNEVLTAKMKVKVYPDGSRKIMPTGEADKYLLLGGPYVLDASLVWKPVDFGTPTRTANKLTWTKAVGQMSVTHIGHGLKHEIELYGGYVPRNSQFAYPLTLNNLARVGASLVDNGVTVAVLQKPVVYDAANPQDVRQITYSFAALNGVTPAVVSTLPDLTGMTRPIVDPTVTLQPDATAGVDTFLRADVPLNSYGASVSFGIGENNTLEGGVMRSLIYFGTLPILPNASVISAKLNLYVIDDLADNPSTIYIYRLMRGWTDGTGDGEVTGDGATWNTYNGVNNWPGGAGGFGAADCEQTDIGSRAFTAAETLNEFKSFELSASAIQEMVRGAFTNNGFMAKTDGELNDEYGFASSDNPDADKRPYLVIEHTTNNNHSPRWNRMKSLREPRGRIY